MLTLEQSVEQEQLSRVSNLLNERFKGRHARDMSARRGALTELGHVISRIVQEIMSGVDCQADDALYRDGLAHILEEPEFLLGPQVREIVQALEGPTLSAMVSTVAQPLQVGGLQVLIGGEGRYHEFADLALVLSRYGVAGGASGLLGVVGPVRMTYDRTIGAVRYVSQLMSDIVNDWYEAPGPAGEPAEDDVAADGDADAQAA
jgi:heat-inducible transcriptional repressor